MVVIQLFLKLNQFNYVIASKKKSKCLEAHTAIQRSRFPGEEVNGK